MTDQDERSDEALLQAHVDGDPDAFSVIVSRHADRMWAVALRTIRDPDDASDAVQDAMISAFRRAETFRGTAKVSTWLHRIVVNACLDRMRAKKSRQTVALPEAEADLGTPDPHDRIDQHMTRMTVQDALAQLPPDQRVAITLVDLEGWSIDEAADILQCPPGTVKSRCHRGRSRLYTLLGNPDGHGTVTTTEAPPDPIPPDPKGGAQ